MSPGGSPSGTALQLGSRAGSGGLSGIGLHAALSVCGFRAACLDGRPARCARGCSAGPSLIQSQRWFCSAQWRSRLGCASQFPVRPSWSVRWVWGVGFPVSPVSLQGPAPDWTLWGLCRAQQRRCALQRSLPRLLCPTALFWVPRPAPRPSCRAKRTSPGGEGVLRPQCRRPGSLLCRVGTAEHRSPCSF